LSLLRDCHPKLDLGSRNNATGFRVKHGMTNSFELRNTAKDWKKSDCGCILPNRGVIISPSTGSLEGYLRFKVPQNIDMQDKILGPLTMLQFIYAVIGFGICYIASNSLPSPLSYVVIVPVALFVFCLDFIKVNERPFTDFIKAAIVFATTPRQRLWIEGGSSDFNIEIYHAVKQDQNSFQSKNIDHNEIRKMARTLDTDNQKIIKN